MVFSSLTFLLVFLPVLLILYFLIKNIKIKNILLLIFSLVFYAWGEPIYIFLMLLSILVTYIFGLLISKNGKKSTLIIGIIILLSSLFFFKYSNFLITNLNSLFNINIKEIKLALPIGISFYTFQAISYLIDLYWKKTKVEKNVLSLALYISLFPQLIAGPIVRYETIANEIANRKSDLSSVEKGLKRFIIGLSKKVIIANNMALIVDSIYESNTEYGTLVLWLAAICYTLQIYYDFSGYSDMAIGLGKIFGFSFLENFNYPYISNSVTEFWRRWHISLSTWFRDYVYIPLGGSRVKRIKHIRNILIVWLLTGLWHGANWNFIIWGIYYGLLLLFEKFILKDKINKINNIVRHLITILIVIIGWVIFRLTDLSYLLVVLKNMFIWNGSGLLDFIYDHANLIINLYMIIPAIVFSIPLKLNKGKKINKLIVDFIYICLYIGNVALLVSNTYNPFIYFRF